MSDSAHNDSPFEVKAEEGGLSTVAPNQSLASPGAKTNNPYHLAARRYELGLSLPIISAIRCQEARAVSELIARYGNPDRRALEIGPGTGFYTLGLARVFREVVAIEDSGAMIQLLRKKLQAAGVSNVTAINGDFLSVEPNGPFDIAVAIGVLDYISVPAAFVAKMCAYAQKAVIFTVPQRGLWGKCFAAANRLRHTRVYCYDYCSPGRWARGWRCTMREVGLKTAFTKGLTLVAKLERP